MRIFVGTQPSGQVSVTWTEVAQWTQAPTTATTQTTPSTTPLTMLPLIFDAVGGLIVPQDVVGYSKGSPPEPPPGPPILGIPQSRIDAMNTPVPPPVMRIPGE
jgi:hypothetical protein